MLKIANIIGARPQFVKYFPVGRAICANNDHGAEPLQDILVHTGQHYDYKMSKIFFDQLGIKTPDYHLGVGSGTHGQQTGEAIKKIEEVLLKEKPDMVVVYGDTNSTLAGALAAVKLHIPIAHIEAGLRSYNRKMPEENNRVLTDHISSLLFCPTKTAVGNLQREGIRNIINRGRLVDAQAINTIPSNSSVSVLNVGDVMYDVVLLTFPSAERESMVIAQLGLKEKGYHVLTLHRAENTDDPERFSEIVRFVNEVSAGKTVVFPMHPRTKKMYSSVDTKFRTSVKIVEPLGYFDGLVLLKNSSLLMTDSGGMQKEAFWLKVPCITLRDETEWVETVKSGWNVLYKDYTGKHSPTKSASMAYGDGKAAEKIVVTVKNDLSNSR